MSSKDLNEATRLIFDITKAALEQGVKPSVIERVVEAGMYSLIDMLTMYPLLMCTYSSKWGFIPRIDSFAGSQLDASPAGQERKEVGRGRGVIDWRPRLHGVRVWW